MNWEKKQKQICSKFNVKPYLNLEDSKLGISLNVKQEIYPINGMRINPELDTNGWYIWAGEEYSEDADFFKPLHLRHIESWCVKVIPYLLLPPGWRFLLAPEYEDVWFDKNLLIDKS